MYASGSEQRSRARIQELADRLYRERYHHLLRIARGNCANLADAEEAVQFAFLAFLSHFDPDGDAPPLPWLTLTLKRECWAKYSREHWDRRAGQETMADCDDRGCSLEAIASSAASPDETIERAECMLEARRRLVQLKPAERRALSLIAAGFSYREVCEITEWSYTKVNRCAAEGRAALRAVHSLT